VRRSLQIAIALAAFLVTLVRAHHSPAAFDMTQVVAFEGTVTRFEWRNPHVYLQIEDVDQVQWLIETDATPVLTRSGWSQDSFAPGDQVVVRARPDKDRSKRHGLLLSIQAPDGEVFASMNRSQRSDGPRPVASATDFSGVWQGELLPVSNSIRIPLIGEIASHPTTEQGAAARSAFDISMMPVAECISEPTPSLLGLTAIYLGEFEVQENAIVFRSELYDAERIIYMDGRDHPTNGERTNQGHSIGRWEGDTLVVDTALFADHRSPYAVGIPSGSQKHVVERYRLSDDGTQMLIDVFMEDPEFFAEPYTSSLVWNYSPHLERLSIACDPEVARRFLE
jgi:hypothetical protein